jgi:hypothetical protein
MKSIMKILGFLALSLLAMSFAAAANDESSGAGTVAEKIDVPNYVYLRLAEDDRWLASSPTDVIVGDQVKYGGGALMKDFYSPTLDRTFDFILFVTDIEHLDDTTVASEADPHAGLSGALPPGPAVDPHGPPVAAVTAVTSPAPGDIAPLVGGLTVGEVMGSGESLAGQEVSLRARVMKVSPQILGKNWVTLQDGTGTAPDDHLVAMTDEVVAPGDLVTVKGTVRNDVDIGAGYNYKVLLEDASFSK